MEMSTSAIIKGHWKTRQNPKSSWGNFYLYVGMIISFAAYPIANVSTIVSWDRNSRNIRSSVHQKLYDTVSNYEIASSGDQTAKLWRSARDRPLVFLYRWLPAAGLHTLGNFVVKASMIPAGLALRLWSWTVCDENSARPVTCHAINEFPISPSDLEVRTPH